MHFPGVLAFAEARATITLQMFGILRRVPVPGYDLSFVITARHCWEFSKESLIGFICSFIQQSVSANSLKMMISSRGRAIATDYLRGLA